MPYNVLDKLKIAKGKLWDPNIKSVTVVKPWAGKHELPFSRSNNSKKAWSWVKGAIQTNHQWLYSWSCFSNHFEVFVKIGHRKFLTVGLNLDARAPKLQGASPKNRSLGQKTV